MVWRRAAAAGVAVSAVAVLAACGAAGAGAPAAHTETGAAAVGTAVTGAGSPGTGVPGSAAAAAAQAAGTPVSGTFVIDDAHSTASYTAHETFLGQNTPATPVGTTSAIDGDIVLAAGRVQPSTVTVDLRTLKTDNPMRDHHIQTDPLQTSRYPDASFAAAASPAPAPLIAAGATVSLPIAGTLTIHGTARPMTFDAKVDASGATLHLTGASSFNFSDFGLQPPNIAGFVAVEQGIQLSVDLTATRQ